MRALAAALLLPTLSACGTGASAQAAAGTPLPVAPPPSPLHGIACATDVKPCPDGGFVSRSPARGCTFNPCPGASHN